MADDKTKVAPGDRKQINVHEDYEVAYWTKALGVNKEELTRLVQEVGTSAAAVRERLGK